MKLPEPTRQAWRRHREAIRPIATEEAEDGRMLIGGGTILAARWEHRLSRDIDVLMPERDGLEDTHPGRHNDLAGATGGEVEEKWENRIKVKVEETTLDVSAMKPQLPGLEKETELEEQSETVLATAQILRGKLNRSDEGLARDAFDLISAAKADRRALQHAVNALNDRQTLIICHNLISTNDDMAKSAADALHGVASEFETDQSRLGEDAATAIQESRYTRVRLQLEREALTIERRTRKAMERPQSFNSSKVAEALLESGIGEYLRANHGTPPARAVRGIEALVRDGYQGVVFDSEEGGAGRVLEASHRNAETSGDREEAKRKAVQRGGDPAVAAPPARPGEAGQRKAARKTPKRLTPQRTR